MAEFHELVTRIERAIAPEGAVISCPDHVLDLVTGEPREVGAAIRRRPGLAPVRILECRDRAPVEDVRWIEQLATKCRDHGVPTTAVSSVRFSEPAAAKANRYGIETRLMSDVTQDEILGWIRNKEATRLVYFPVLTALNVRTYGTPGAAGERFHPNVIEQLKARRDDAPVFVRRADGQPCTARQILDVAIRNGLPLFERVPEGGTAVRKEAVIDFAKGVFQVQTDAGLRDVSRLSLGVKVHARRLPFPFMDKAFCFYASGRPASYGADAGAVRLGATLVVATDARAETNALRARLTERHVSTRYPVSAA